jgi:hypothetical protein
LPQSPTGKPPTVPVPFDFNMDASGLDPGCTEFVYGLAGLPRGSRMALPSYRIPWHFAYNDLHSLPWRVGGHTIASVVEQPES